MLASWESGRQIVLRANPDCFLGRPCLDEIIYRIIPDEATMFLELSAGIFDMMGLSPYNICDKRLVCNGFVTM